MIGTKIVKNILNIFCNLVSQFFDEVNFYMIEPIVCERISDFSGKEKNPVEISSFLNEKAFRIQ